MRKVNVSNGELIDKYTILSIKIDRIKDKEKLVNVEAEHEMLNPILRELLTIDPMVLKYYIALQEVNNQLWQIEDDLRMLETESRFDREFIELARLVYKTNDQRAAIKNKINKITKSGLTEEKSYK